MSMFAAGTATMDDVLAVARHLVGRQPLGAGDARTADLDRDGRIGASDLWLMLSLVPGGTVVGPTPNIEGIAPDISEPGAAVTLTGAGFGHDASGLVVAIRSGTGMDVVAADSVTDTSIEVTLPAPLGASGTVMASLRAVRAGIASNAVELLVTRQPTIAAIIPDRAGRNASITLRGRNFGQDPAAVVVWFGSTSATATAVANDTIEARVPDLGAVDLQVRVEVGGVPSNTLDFSVLALTPGVVALPLGSPLALESLRVCFLDGQTCPVSADGTFSVRLSGGDVLGGDVIDEQNRAVAAVLARGDLALRVSMQSTAEWWAFFTVGGFGLRPDHRVRLHDRLRVDSAVAALATALSARHAASPDLLDISAGEAAATSLTAATTSAGVASRGILLS